MDLGLKGKTVAVAGATRGIGRAIAKAFAAEGCNVGLCARGADGLARVLAELSDQGVAACGAVADVRDRDAVKRWIDGVATELGGLHGLVANVSAFAVANEPEAWRDAFEVDLMGTIHCVDAALPYMEAAGGGAIVVVGSTAAVETLGPGRPYDAPKTAQITYVKSQSLGYAAKNIRFNVVSPGTTYFEGRRWDQVKAADPARYQDFVERNPTSRMGTPEEIANAVVFIASARASFILSANLIVDGGFTSRVQF